MSKNNLISKLRQLIGRNKLLFGVFVLIFVLIIFTFKDGGISWDEKDQIDLGNNALNYYLSFGKDKSYFNLFPGFDAVYATRGPATEVLVNLVQRIFNQHGVSFYHLLFALLTSIVFYFIYKIIYLITENKFISTISPLFLLFMPRFWGDVFGNSKDAPIGTLVALVILLSILIFKKIKNTKTIYFVSLGVVFGLVCSLRIVAIYLLFLFLGYYLLEFLLNRKDIKFKSFLLNIAVVVVSFFISIHLFSPYLHIKPIFGIFDMLFDSSKFPWNGTMLFDGKLILSTQLPWFYLPKWILITTPIFIVILFVVSMILFFIKFKHLDRFKLISISFIFFSFWLPLIMYFVMKPVIYDAWRHFLFLSVPLVLMSILGLFFLIEYFKKNKTITLIIYLFVLFGFFVTGISYVKLHPYEYSYFNSLVGGLPGAYGKYETDYWGKSYKEAIDWLNKNTSDIKTIYVKSCGHSFSSTYYMKKNLVFTGKFEEADYFVCYTRNFEHLSIDDSKTIYIIEREGVPLNYIKKLK